MIIDEADIIEEARLLVLERDLMLAIMEIANRLAQGDSGRMIRISALMMIQHNSRMSKIYLDSLAEGIQAANADALRGAKRDA